MVHSFLSLLLTAFPLASPVSGVDCPSGWRRVGESCFILSATGHSFESCMKHVCGPMQATLACVGENNSEALALHSFALSDTHVNATGTGRGVWVGYHNAAPDGQWRWANGCESRWQRWQRGQPGNECGGEHCAALGPQGLLYGSSCRMPMRCLCEYPGAPTKDYFDGIPKMREDTCYEGCGRHAGGGWCRAWPFWEPARWEYPTCQWQREAARGFTDGMGPGLRHCVSRVRKYHTCGDYVSYAEGEACTCTRMSGEDPTCRQRQTSEKYDMFFLTPYGGVEHVSHGERCAMTFHIDQQFFSRPNWGSNSKALLGVWVVIGLPCLLFTLSVILHIWNPLKCVRENTTQRFLQGKLLQNKVGDYGEVLKQDNPVNSGIVNRWMQACSACTALHGIALMINGARFQFDYDPTSLAYLSMVMGVASFGVGTTALVVYGYLSPVARRITGFWMWVLSFSKFLAGLCSLGLMATYLEQIRTHADHTSICISYYAWQWLGLVLLPLQCLSGAALWRIRVRAGVEGGLASVCLVAGSFGVGLGMWAAGFLSNLTSRRLSWEPLIGPCYMFAAVSHLIAAVALLVVNKEVKQAAVVELVDDPELVTSTDHRSDLELPRRRQLYGSLKRSGLRGRCV